jgi:ubiquinone/menaquinone biosynthesis C-methylase UbiE
MAAVMTNADIRFWNNIARKYATDPIADMGGYEATLARVGDLLGPTDRALELGCGTGMTALRLASRLGYLTATDASSEMIAIAQDRRDGAGVSNVSFAVAPAEADVVAEGSCDAVLAFNVLHLVVNRAAVYQSIQRALRPGGLFISKTACIREMSILLRMGIPVARAIGKAPTIAMFDGLALEAEIAEAGFQIMESGRHGTKRRDPRLFVVAHRP